MPAQSTRTQTVPKPDALTIEIHRDIAAVCDLWRDLQRTTDAGPHDTWEWSNAWSQTVGNTIEPLIVIGRTTNGDALFLLPLAIRERRGCSVLEWFSPDQGNYASGLFHRTAWNHSDLPRGKTLLTHILAALPRVDAVHLKNQPARNSGECNPFSDLPVLAAASAGHAFPLSGEWAQHYNERFSSRARSELRRSERRLIEQGELRCAIVAPGLNLEQAMNRMIQDKRRWFAEKGIHDCFADPAICEFFKQLAIMPKGGDAPHLKLFELTVDGNPVAANLGLVHDNTFYGLVSSTTDGSLLRYSPGNVLFLRLVEQLAEEGIERVDCGAGEDTNKLRWCTVERQRLHTIVPVTVKGRIYTASLKTALAAKLHIKQSPRLWTAAKRLRQLTGAGTSQWSALGSRGIKSTAPRLQS